MEFGWFHEEDEGVAEINITPLVDVSLVLLIIFMITAPMLLQGANVNLPQTQPLDKLPSGSVFVAITADGEIFLNDEAEPIEPDVLAERVVPLANLGQAAFLQGDKDARHGRVVAALAALHEAGFGNINIVTSPDPSR